MFSMFYPPLGKFLEIKKPWGIPMASKRKSHGELPPHPRLFLFFEKKPIRVGLFGATTSQTCLSFDC
jgi:hypothetical protein